jgi:hypothetical protein
MTTAAPSTALATIQLVFTPEADSSRAPRPD